MEMKTIMEEGKSHLQECLMVEKKLSNTYDKMRDGRMGTTNKIKKDIF